MSRCRAPATRSVPTSVVTRAAAVESVCASSAEETDPALMTEATKLVRFSRAVRTSSSAAFDFSLPAWTSTLATPERAECGASASVSNVEMPDQ